MNILDPIALLFGLIAIPVVLLYLLRLQRREQVVSSTLLWRQVVMDREANTLWQRLRPNILLLLQLLTLAFLVFALIRPYLNLPGGVAAKTVLLLDGSASMQATDVSPSRFDQAKARARDLINGMGGGDELALILVEGSPRTLIGLTSSKVELINALEEARASLSVANWSAAVALAKAVTGGGAVDQATNRQYVVIGDGAHTEDLRFLTGDTRFVPVGANANNVFISALTVRQTLRGLAAFVRVSNTGAEPAATLVTLRGGPLGRPDALINARNVSVPPGSSTTWTVNEIDPAVGGVSARIELQDRPERNTLALDDMAYAVNALGATRRALLVTRGNRFLEQALAAVPGLQVVRATPDGAGALQEAQQALSGVGARPYDLYVLDGLTVTLPANANVMLLGAQQLFSTTGVFSDTAYARTEAHSVSANVDWRNVNVLDARRVSPPSWLKPVIETAGGPLVLAGDTVDVADPAENPLAIGRAVVLPFDLFKSDLPLNIAFPILVANAVDWLAPPQGFGLPSSVRPGEVVPLPRGSLVTLPSGVQTPVDDRGFASTSQLGIYQVQTAQSAGAFAVNFLNARESDIRPSPQVQFGESATPADGRPQLAQREVWHVAAALALVLLLVEWWIYQRGLPGRKSAI